MIKKNEGGEKMDVQQFGIFLQQRRKELGMKQSDLAERLHVTDKAISRWERGVGFPDIKLLEPLADALGLSLTELLKCEIMEKPLPEAAKAETVQIMEEQKKLSWQRRLVLWLGQGALIAAAYVLIYISRHGGLSFGQQFAVYAITFIGSFFAHLALKFVVERLYLTNRPWGIWHRGYTWIAYALLMVGVLVVRYGTRSGSDTKDMLMTLFGAALAGGGYLYYHLKKEQEEE